MADTTIPTTLCPHCGSEMYPDDDVSNTVKVFVCSKPTCLNRIYPDYPPRSGNQEICYLCSSIFTVHEDCPGPLCPTCKALMKKSKQRARRNTAGRSQHRSTHTERRLTA